jgi:hypothetical protein
MANSIPSSLSDHDLLVETVRAASVERQATSVLLALLAEVDTRRLYLGQGFSSLFGYCTQRLALSESATYSRITAARTARRFPVILPMLAAGSITLTTVSLLAAHLTEENHAALLEAAARKSKRDLERMVAAIHPQPDIPSSVRALPTARTVQTVALSPQPLKLPTPVDAAPLVSNSPAEVGRPPAVIAPLAPHRYLLKVTVCEVTYQKLQRARDLLRCVIPDGDPAAILDRALTLLVEHAERAKLAATSRPRTKPGQHRPASGQKSRRVPASVRRTVWARDEGRCAFVGSHGRCAEMGWLEFHHVVPFAAGGPTTVENIELRCRAHNVFESTLVFGEWRGKGSTSKGSEALFSPADSG